MNEGRDFDSISGSWPTSTDPYNYADFDPFEAGANTGCHGCGTGHACLACMSARRGDSIPP
jgi:hypothetical protein